MNGLKYVDGYVKDFPMGWRLIWTIDIARGSRRCGLTVRFRNGGQSTGISRQAAAELIREFRRPHG